MSYKKLLASLALLTCTTLTLHAQETTPQVQSVQGTATVSGRIADSISGQALEWCTIVLQAEGQGAQLSVNADSTGKFTFKDLAAGNYALSVFYVGYERYDRQITVAGDELNLGTINLYTNAEKLGEVTITDVRKLIDIRPDGIVYNADKDATSKGGTADQLLRKVPMVTVDLEGNVQLRGNGNIKVLINGKPSTIIASSVKDALRQIPADNIKQVEVITSPGAKYDGEGTAGVINIITRKSLIQGISGSVYSSANYRIDHEQMNGMLGTNITYRQGKLGLNANIGGGRWTNLFDGNTVRTNFAGTPDESVLRQSNRTFGYGSFYWGELSGDYQIDSLQSIQAGINVNPGKWTNEVSRKNKVDGGSTDFDTRVIEESPQRNYSFNGAYSRKFKNNPLRSLDILSQYSLGNEQQNYTLSRLNNNTSHNDYKEDNSNKTKNNELTVQADYVQPLGKKPGRKLETGLKYIRRDVGSDYLLALWNEGDGDFSVDPARSNRLDYSQQVAAAYGQLSTPLSKKLNLVAGLRYEFTGIEGSLRDNGGEFSSEFNNLLPNAILSLDLKNYSKLKISYNKRIERPSIQFVNPFVNYNDPLNIQYGNPELEPEITHNVELGFNTMLGKTTMLNAAVFYRNTGNAIEQVATVGTDGINRTTFRNVATNNASGLNLFASSTFFSKWMININGNAYYKHMKSAALDITNDGIQYDFNMYSNFRLNDKWSIEGFGMYQGRQVMLQGTQTGWYYYNLGVKRTVLQGKGDLTLVGENFLTRKVKIRLDYQYLNADMYGDFNAYASGIKLSFNYRFGKMNFYNKGDKSIKNDDLKGGGSGGMGGGQQGGM